MAQLFDIAKEFFTETLVLEHDLHTNPNSGRVMADYTYELPFISVVLYLLMVFLLSFYPYVLGLTNYCIFLFVYFRSLGSLGCSRVPNLRN